MKICPFISHMIGEDRADVLQIDASPKSSSTSSSKKKKDAGPDVVILGYDGEAAVGVQTKTKSKSKSKTSKDETSVPSHLFCLKETCRFFVKKNESCKFDSVFDMSQEQSKKVEQIERSTNLIEGVEKRLDHIDRLDQLEKLEKLEKIDAVDEILKKVADVQELIRKAEASKQDGGADKTTAKVTKELDKFWKFQTKSVSELIASLGDIESKQDKQLKEFKTQMSKSLDTWKPQIDLKAVDDIKKDVVRLREAVESRDDGIESFSTTVSELMLNIDDTLKGLQGKSDKIVERVEKLESSMPQFDSSIRKLEDTIGAKLNSTGKNDVSKEIQSLNGRVEERFDDIAGAYDRIVKDMASWQNEMTKKVEEVGNRQDSWKDHLERIEKKQTEVMALVRQDREKVDDETAQLRQLKKKEAKKFNNLGVTSFHNGEYELARDQFLEAVGLDPQFAESWNNLGLVYTELEDDDGAREAFSKAIDINPDLPAAYNNLGYIFYKQEEYEMAIKMYSEAINRSSDNSSAYTNLGNAYFKLGNSDDASTAWRKALEIDPANEKASRNLSRLNKE